MSGRKCRELFNTPTMLFFCVFLLIAAVGAFGPPTVDELDVGKYTGRWYQTHASPVVYATFERNGYCVTATYGVYNESTLTVKNDMRIDGPEGKVSDIEGFAFTTEEAGKLGVVLGGSPFPAPYWVLQLGPVSKYNGVEQYSYSIVGDPTYLYLFVLVRDVDEFTAVYEEDVLNWLAANGYDKARNRPIETYHGKDCIYPDV